jgi:transcriptional regulator with XRE-family HTH domain
MQARRHGLARQRKAAGYSQEELAERLGVERSTVVRWEAGDTEPQPGLRPKIARALRVSLAQLDELLASDRDTDVDGPEDRQPSTSVDFVTVAQLRSDVQQLDEQYDHLPSAALLAKAGQCLGQVAVLNGHVTCGRVRRDLCAVEAEAATLMGQLVWDASQRRDHTAARGYFDQAIAAARHVHDPIAEGFALLRKKLRRPLRRTGTAGRAEPDRTGRPRHHRFQQRPGRPRHPALRRGTRHARPAA